MKNLIAAIVAASFISLSANASFAACADEIEAVQSAFESAELDEAAQGTVSEAIDAALASSEAGNEDECLAAIDEAKAILDIE